MTLRKLLFSLLILVATSTFAQIKVDQIEVNNKTRFITTVIGYPISGTYLFNNKKEPVIQLNENGSGIFQLHDKPQTAMTWGIECSNITFLQSQKVRGQYFTPFLERRSTFC